MIRGTNLALMMCLALGCGGGDGAPAADADAAPRTEFGANRPVTLQVPATYDPAVAAPLVLALHGFFTEPGYWGPLTNLPQLAERERFLFAAPIGTADQDGVVFWNATDACCDKFDAGVDDVAYLSGLIDEISDVYNVDPKRVYLVGHSNGGFMAHRMACDAADEIAAIISVAGATWDDPEKCAPGGPVNVLQIHGDADTSISFEGGTSRQGDGSDVPYPGAVGTVTRWAGYNGCASTTTAGDPVDVDALVDGPDGNDAEALADRYDGCPAGGAVELWRAVGVMHLPLLSPRSAEALWGWLDAHPKP